MRKRYLLTRLRLIGCALIVLLTGYNARGNGAIFHSQHFAIHNMSGATEQELQDFATILEQAYADVATFLEKAPPSSIWVSLEDRRAIPSARGGKLAFYRYGGRIQAEAAAMADASRQRLRPMKSCTSPRATLLRLSLRRGWRSM
jgi:hypothetical protein